MKKNSKSKVVPLRKDHPMNFVRNATALKTVHGWLVNYGGFCFFVDKAFNYVPWRKTLEKGILPSNNEFGRLRKEKDEDGKLSCPERTLTDEEMRIAFQIKIVLERDRYYGIPLKEQRIARAGYGKYLIEKALKKAPIRSSKKKKAKTTNDFRQLSAIVSFG